MNHHLLSFVRLEKAIAPHRTGEVTSRLPFLAVPDTNIQYFLPLIKKFFSYYWNFIYIFSDHHYILNRVATSWKDKKKIQIFYSLLSPQKYSLPRYGEDPGTLHFLFGSNPLFLKNKPYSFKSYRSRAHNASLYFYVSWVGEESTGRKLKYRVI